MQIGFAPPPAWADRGIEVTIEPALPDDLLGFARRRLGAGRVLGRTDGATVEGWPVVMVDGDDAQHRFLFVFYLLDDRGATALARWPAGDDARAEVAGALLAALVDWGAPPPALAVLWERFGEV